MGAAASRRAPLVLVAAVSAVLGFAAWLIVVAWPGGARDDASAIPYGRVLDSGPGFSIGGRAGGLAPGRFSALLLTVASSYRVPIVLTSVTVTMTAVPPGCPAILLGLGHRKFRGHPPVVVLRLHRRVPALGTVRIAEPIRLARRSPNACQRARFPFAYRGEARRAARAHHRHRRRWCLAPAAGRKPAWCRSAGP